MSGELWYFAYGSNLDPRTFLGRRRMRPLETAVGVLEDYALCFDLPVGRTERGVANLRPRREARVWGVLYRLTSEEFERLDRTEGVSHGAYRRIPVSVVAAGGVVYRAFAYRSDRGRPGRRPSARYLNLLIAGARHHGLPAAYVQELRAIDIAVDEREGGQQRLL